MFFEMRFDLGTLDSGERSLPFGLLVVNLFNMVRYGCHIGVKFLFITVSNNCALEFILAGLKFISRRHVHIKHADSSDHVSKN